MIVLNFILGLSELFGAGVQRLLLHEPYRKRFSEKMVVCAGIFVLWGGIQHSDPLFYSDYVNIGAGLLMVSLIGHFLFNKKGLYIFYYMFYMVCVHLPDCSSLGDAGTIELYPGPICIL